MEKLRHFTPRKTNKNRKNPHFHPPPHDSDNKKPLNPYGIKGWGMERAMRFEVIATPHTINELQSWFYFYASFYALLMASRTCRRSEVAGLFVCAGGIVNARKAGAFWENLRGKGMARTKKRRTMSYVESTLLGGEAVYGLGSLHWAGLVAPLMYALTGTLLVTMGLSWTALHEHSKLWLAVLILPNLTFVQAVIYFLTTESAVTNSRVLLKTGWISRMTDEISLSKVESILMNQGIIGRIFGFGNVTVIGTGGNKVIVRGICDPMQFRSTVHAMAMSVK